MPLSLQKAGPTAAILLRTVRPLPPSYWVKYGARRYLEEALRTGRLRIAPASTYRDPSLNTAIHDNELEALIAYDPNVPFNDIPPGTMLLPHGRVPVRQELQSDYYVYCLAGDLSSRLFLDFEADACLVVHDPDMFKSRVLSAARAQLLDWDALAGPVRYYDPLLVAPPEIQLPMSKHFRFAYQKEIRLAWLPRTPAADLKPFFVNIGNMTALQSSWSHDRLKKPWSSRTPNDRTWRPDTLNCSMAFPASLKLNPLPAAWHPEL